MYSTLAAATLLLAAAAGDLRDYRIPNGLIFIGYAAGSFYSYLRLGRTFFPTFVFDAVWPVVLLYVLFYIGALGAGDVKLFSVVSVFVGFSAMKTLLPLAFFIGGAAAAVKMLYSGDLIYRMSHLFSHVSRCIVTKKPVPYVPVGKCRELHFSLSILTAFLITEVMS